MKKVLTIFVLAIFLLCFTQNNDTELIKQFKEKFSKYENIKSIKATYKATFYNEEEQYPATVTIVSKGKKIKTEIIPDSAEFREVPQLDVTIINDGEDMYMINMVTGKVKINDSDKNYYYQDKGIKYWKVNFDDYVYEGNQKVNKIQTSVFSKQEDKNSKIFIDNKTLFLIQQQEILNNDILLLTYENYKKIQSDYYMPHKLILNMNGKKIMVMELQNIVLNPEIDDSEFEVEEDESMDLDEYFKNYDE